MMIRNIFWNKIKIVVKEKIFSLPKQVYNL